MISVHLVSSGMPNPKMSSEAGFDVWCPRVGTINVPVLYCRTAINCFVCQSPFRKCQLPLWKRLFLIHLYINSAFWKCLAPYDSINHGWCNSFIYTFICLHIQQENISIKWQLRPKHVSSHSMFNVISIILLYTILYFYTILHVIKHMNIQ